MRILYIISELTFGGAQKQLVELSRELVRNGHEVMIYTLNRDVPRQSELEHSGVQLIVDQKKTRLDFAVMWRLRSTIARYCPDIIHGFLFDGDLYSRIAAIGSGVPVLNSERSDNYRLSLAQYFAHRLTRGLARGVVANTHSGKSFAARLFALPSEDVHVVWNGLRVDELKCRAASTTNYRAQFFGSPDCRVACFVGAIKPAKDYHLALATAANLVTQHPQWRVLFIGDQLSAAGQYRPGKQSDTGAYKNAVLENYQQLGLDDKIKFTGLRSDVPAIVSQSDVLFVTSLQEGFPNSVLEAMGLGVPVVSTRYSDIEQILPIPGQVVEKRCAADLARAILWAYSQRDNITSSQSQWVQTHATIERAALQFEQIYQKYVHCQNQAVTA